MEDDLHFVFSYLHMANVLTGIRILCGILILFIGGDYAWQAKAVVIIAICMLTSIAAIAEGFAILRR